MARRFTKDPDENLDYELNWSVELKVGETIATSTWIAPTGIVLGPAGGLPAQTISGANTKAWLGGGTVGNAYAIVNRITTNQSRTIEEVIILDIVDSSTVRACALPVEFDELKRHLRITHDFEDELLRTYLKASDDWFRMRTGRTFITCDYTLKVDGWFTDCELRECPFVGVKAVKYLDSTGATQTLDPANYYVTTNALHGTLRIKPSVSLPTLYDARVDRVSIEYSAGYGTRSEDVASQAKLGIMMLAGHWYQHREPVNVGSSVTPIPFTVEMLAASLWSGEYVPA